MNILTVIANEQIVDYLLDDRQEWKIGRPSKDNNPDVKLFSITISRRHGKFKNVDGIWFYDDFYGKNGTYYNGKMLQPGIGRKQKSIMLNDGDWFVFGSGESMELNEKTVWARFSEPQTPYTWRTVDTKGMSIIEIMDGDRKIVFNKPEKGCVAGLMNGCVIYMGDVCYVSGAVSINARR